MKKGLYPCLFVLFVGAATSCRTTEQTAATDEVVKTVSSSINELASAQAKIIGKIIWIDEVREAEGPCAKAPCRARIVIKTLEKKGSLYQGGNAGDTLSVSFAFTLAATTPELFPGMKTSFPGLSVNDRFEAKIESRLALNEQGVAYLIYEYKKFTYEK